MKHIAIQIEDFDEVKAPSTNVASVAEKDIELGTGAQPQRKEGIAASNFQKTLSSSTEQLLHGEQTPSQKASTRSSIGFGKRLALSIISSFGSFIATTKVFWVVVLYTIFGAYLFLWLEAPFDVEEKRKAHEYHLVARDVLLFKIETIHNERAILEKAQHWKQAILEFEQNSDFQLPRNESAWTFWMAVLYCATIYTTVGYGNIACATTGGRVTTIFYAICGIPLMIVVLDQLGTFLLRKMRQTSNFIDDVLFYLGVRYHVVDLADQEAFLRYIAICRTLARWKLIPSTITLSITEPEEEDTASSSASASTSSSSSSSKAMEDRTKRNARSRERRSLKIAISKGSLLNNVGPFYIESIDTVVEGGTPEEALAKQLLLSPPNVSASRRSSRTSTATIRLKLDDTDELMGTSKHSSNRDHSSAASIHSNVEKTRKEGEDKSPMAPKNRRSPPLLIALTVTTGWIAFAAAVFCLWEEWTYFTSVYFFFVSVSTIGFGDVTPAHPQYMIATFFVVVVGLSLVSVCINVVQEKVSLVYMDFLNKMLQQYMRAKASGDVEALKGAMAGFNERCKYLMPFISRNQGIRIMNQFKEEAKAMGVELPDVLTELSEETGKPAFCSIFDEKSDAKVNQFLEQAHSKGKMRRNAHTQTKMPMPKAHKFFISKAEADKEEFEVQTECWDNAKLDIGTQTSSDLTDSGIQCCPSVRSVGTEWDATERDWSVVDCWTNTPFVQMKSAGVQPEVSCIMRVLDEDESDFALSDYEDEEVDFSSSGLSKLGGPDLFSGSSREGELERLFSIGSKRSLQMQRVPEIELDEATDAVKMATMAPQSPPTVTIRMASKAPTEEEDAGGGEGAGDTTAPGKAGRRRKRREGLRYLRNAAIQVNLPKSAADFSTQFGPEHIERAQSAGPFGHQFQLGTGQSGPPFARMGTTETGGDPLSFETADDWRTSFGAQTDPQRKPSATKRVQTERPLCVSRPVQTQLTSTFRHAGPVRTLDGTAAAAVRSESEVRIEHGALAEVEREREELRKLFDLDQGEVEVLRRKVSLIKQRKREERRKRKESSAGEGALISEEKDEEEMGEEEKRWLAEEIRKMKRAKAEREKARRGGREMSKDEEEEEESEEEEEVEEEEAKEEFEQKEAEKKRGKIPEEQTKNMEEDEDVQRRAKRTKKRVLPRAKWQKTSDGGVSISVEPSEFTLQISKPAENVIRRENYEETTLDIQLIRSPFFETRYLPQSEDRMIFAEAELAVVEPKGRGKKGRKKAEEEIDIGKLLGKLSRLDAISLKEEDEMRHLAGIRRQMTVDLEEQLQVEQFTAESFAQTELFPMAGAMDVAQLLHNNPDTTLEELADLVQSVGEFRRFKAAKAGKKWHKWTQTDWADGGKTKAKKSLIERVAHVWSSKLERALSGDKRTMEKKEPETEDIAGLPSASAASSSVVFGEKESELIDGKKESTTAKTKKGRKTAKLKGRHIGQMVGRFEGETGSEQRQQLAEQMDLVTAQTGEGTVPPLDLAQIVLVQTPSNGVEPRKLLHPLGGEDGAESELVPLERQELAQFMALFTGMAGPEAAAPSTSAQGTLQFLWQSSIEALLGGYPEQQQRTGRERQQQRLRVMRTAEGGIELVGEPKEERQIGTGEVRLIPMTNLMAGWPPGTSIPQTAGRHSTEPFGAYEDQHRKLSLSSGILPWPHSPGPPEFGGELEYYRRWLERLFAEARERAQNRYDIPLRDISEFLRVRRAELSELESQKRQMERMAELGAKGDRAERMVDVSIQTGVHSRVVPIMATGPATTPGQREEINYLANPLCPIVTVPLQLAEEEVMKM